MAEPLASPWLLLIHQLPPKPPYLRVKVWRRLQGLGAVAIKSSVYVLPNTEDSREDFEWMLREIRQAGGDASICEARLVDGLTDEEVRGSFQSAREADYRALATDLRTFARETLPRRDRAIPADLRARIETALLRFRKRFEEIEKLDFFAAPGRETVEGLLADLEGRLGPEGGASSAVKTLRRVEDVRKRVWVTRKGIHVDRIASAWLIRRFIDPEARFEFVPSKGYRTQKDELRFDMFDADFTHDGGLCTFEVLLRDFAIGDPALQPIAEIVHDIDLKDGKFARPEGAGIDRLIAGIAWTSSDDEQRLARGSVLFDALYVYFRRRKG